MADTNFDHDFPALDSENESENEKENTATKEESEATIRLKSALYYNIGRTVEEVTTKEGKSYTKEYLACLNEVMMDLKSVDSWVC